MYPKYTGTGAVFFYGVLVYLLVTVALFSMLSCDWQLILFNKMDIFDIKYSTNHEP